MADIDKDYARVREQNKNAQSQNKFISMAEARENKFPINWSKTEITKPSFLGNKVFNDYDLKEISEYIDWTPFFHSWEMKGSYPKILKDPARGTEAQKLFEDAQNMLKKIIDEKWLTANAVIGIYPANTVNDDDIEIVYENASLPDKQGTTSKYLPGAGAMAEAESERYLNGTINLRGTSRIG